MSQQSHQNSESSKQSNSAADVQLENDTTSHLIDKRPEAVAQRKLQEMARNSTHVSQLRAFHDIANNTPQSKQTIQQPIQRQENNTGLPDNLKSGMEKLSGYSMDDVRVHRNSDKPAQLQAHAYAQGTNIHLGPGQEKHLPHELGHVVQQKEGRVKPTIQMKGKVNVNDDKGLEKEADVLGQKAQSVGMNSETGNDIGAAQHMGQGVVQGKFSQDGLHQFPTTQPIQLDQAGKEAAARNNVDSKMIEKVRPLKDKTLEEIKAATGLTNEQITTAQARLFGDTRLLEIKAFNDGKAAAPIRTANSWDKWFVSKLTEENRKKVEEAKARIPTPRQMGLTEEAINAHLGKFADGAHAFIDPQTSGKIKGDIVDANFEGWGVDANFVAPLNEAEELHQRAIAGEGIVTLEKELGISKYVWSRTEWNPKKEMVRWTIPKPLDFKLENNDDFINMATGNETGALVNEWVAGGFTLGGMTEAVVKAIPRPRLLKSLHDGEITDKTVVYTKTPDNIGENGPGTGKKAKL